VLKEKSTIDHSGNSIILHQQRKRIQLEKLHLLLDTTIIFSAKSESYINIEEYLDMHYEDKSTEESSKTTLQWVHIAISNAERWLLGAHHKIKGKYL